MSRTKLSNGSSRKESFRSKTSNKSTSSDFTFRKELASVDREGAMVGTTSVEGAASEFSAGVDAACAFAFDAFGARGFVTFSVFTLSSIKRVTGKEREKYE